jgi:nucleoside-diphosphate kinase
MLREDQHLVESTLIILKPDCTHRRLIGRIIQRFEDKGLTIAAMKLMQISEDLAGRHYAPHKGKPFYPGLIEYITSGPVVVMVLRGPNAIAVCRQMMGKTFGYEAESGTIRGDFGMSKTYNLVHGSDAPETAETEIKLYFEPAEILNYAAVTESWTTKPGEV